MGHLVYMGSIGYIGLSELYEVCVGEMGHLVYMGRNDYIVIYGLCSVSVSNGTLYAYGS